MKRFFMIKNLILLMLCLALIARAELPAITLEIDIGEALVQGVQAEDVRIRVQSGDNQDWRQWTLSVQAPKAQYQGKKVLSPQLDAAFSQDGDDWRIEYARWRGRFAGSMWAVSAEAVQLSQLLQANGDWPAGMRVSLREEGGAVRADFGARHGTASVHLSAAQLTAWLKDAGIALPKTQGLLLAQMTLTRDGGAWQIQSEWRLENGTWSSADGLYALEKGQGRLQFSAKGRDTRWQGDFALQIDGGEALLSPLYFQLNDNPLSLSGQWRLQADALQFSAVRFVEREVHGEFALALHWPSLALQTLDVQRASGDADALYQRYARPFLTDTLFADLNLKGTLFAALHWHDGQWRDWSGVFHQVDVVDGQGRFALYGLDGQFGRGGISRVEGRAAMWRKLPVGAWQALFRWEDEGVHLQAPLRLPILGGALVLSRLEPMGAHEYRLDAHIEPIDLSEFSEALDLPPFGGQVSGEFRQIHVNRDHLHLQEPVFINIFGGRVAVENLRLAQMFSAQPLLFFNLDVDALDLAQLARVMQVAEIQGNISGKAHDVQIAGGKVQRFRAKVFTTPDNPGKRLISHEAVQYLSQAGGGSALVGEFVRVLNAFPYEKLGFSADLADNVLHMDGVETAADGGYYLVKGRGLPNLNIIAYERRVDWPELLRRLNAARHTDSAVVE